MALTIIATPGSATANAYCTLAEADAYCESHVAGEAWVDADEDMKLAAIIQATRELDSYVEWTGAPTTIGTQALAWPRCGMYAPNAGLVDPSSWAVIPSNVIPARLKNACAEQARLLIAGDRAAELDQQVQGLSALSVGNGAVSLNFQGNSLPRQVIAPSAWAFISWWGAMRQSSRGGSVPLQRV